MSRTTLEVPADDAISLTLSNFKPEDLLNVIEGFKKVADQDITQCKAMLEANPDLTYAVLQAQFLMGMIDEEVVAEAMKSTESNSDTPSVSTLGENSTATSAQVSDAATTDVSSATSSAPALGSLKNLPSEQAAMIRQVVEISEEQLALLPPEQQEQVRLLKQQYSL